MEDRREELIQRRTELIKRIDAIRADVGRGLDNDTEDQAIELENLEVLEEISRIAREELNKVLHQMHASHPFGELAKHCTSFELLFNPQENNTVLLLHFLRKPRPADCLFSRCLAHGTIGLSAILMQVEGYGIYDPLKQTFQGHILDLLAAKFGGRKTFDTLLYVCAPEFDFYPFAVMFFLLPSLVLEGICRDFFYILY